MWGVKMREKKLRILMPLLTGIMLLFGCGQSDRPVMETVDSNVNEVTEQVSMESLPVGSEEHTGDKGETEDGEQDQEEAGASMEEVPAGEQREPLDVPVNVTAEDIIYHSEDEISLAAAQQRCVSDGENIYLAYGTQDLYAMPLGGDRHRQVKLDNPEGLYVYDIAMDIYGGLHLLMSRDDGGCQIWRLREDFQVDKVIDISAYYETKQLPRWFWVDRDGAYFLQWRTERDGIIIDSEGELRHRFTPESLETGWIYKATGGSDGRIYLIHSEQGEGWEISALDMESCSMQRQDSPLLFSKDEVFLEESGGTDTSLLMYSPYSGVWACDTEKGIMENRVPLSEIDQDGGDITPLAFLADGRLLLLTYADEEVHLKYTPAGR
ncbi:MAG: hypothetical protein NC543_03690 [bacterium]|nr:hypothetical protein [bacterium]MCM1373839.1 hypothetical protein [Muribaculum sp.]